jgi:mRNA deadenylase 3'-5' endonuclease subunit Ccr4
MPKGIKIMHFNKKILALTFCTIIPLTINAVPAKIDAQKLRTAVDKEMRKAFYDSLVSKSDKHKRKISESKDTITMTVDYHYESAPTTIKVVAQKLVADAAKKKAAEAGWFGSKTLTELSATLPFEQGTLTKCTLVWKGDKNDASVIQCSLIGTDDSFLKEDQPVKNSALPATTPSTADNALLG